MYSNIILSENTIQSFLNEKKKKGEIKRKGTCLVLGIVEEKVYYRYVGEHSQRQEHLGEYRVN
jgi:hypothetical protein